MIKATAAAIFLTLAFAPSAHAEEPRPNIVLITSDDHRWDALGAAGNRAVHTPVLDALARDGVYFAQATTPVSQCLPVRTSLLTGLAAHSHGEVSHQHRQAAGGPANELVRFPTVPGLLAKAGYQTVLVGKWHIPLDPWKAGFTEIRTWFDSGGTLYEKAELLEGESRTPKEAKGFTQEILADSGVGFLHSERAKKGPFLLWLALSAPHSPFGPNPARIQKLYLGKQTSELQPPGFPSDVPPGDWRLYDEAVSLLDEQVGRILAAVEQAGLAQSTVIVFAGDNGFMMGERGIGTSGATGKVVPYESSVRVPMIMRGPRIQGFSGPSQAAVSLLDLPPTILALAGLEPPSSWPGRSLLPALSQRDAAGFEDAFSEWADDQSKEFGKLAHRLVRTPTHKLIVWQDPGKPAELYDLVADPRETRNLAGQAGYEAVEKALRQRLRWWLERTADPARSWAARYSPDWLLTSASSSSAV